MPPKHNKILMNLLWDMATWHAYAKLRLHTDDTLWAFREVTIELGDSMRRFEKTVCAEYFTTELPKEYAVRGRREAATTAKRAEKAAKNAQKEDQASNPKRKRKEAVKKTLSLSTPKWHFHGDYADSIDWVGTTDVTSSQRVRVFISLPHIVCTDQC